jgi:MFS family permease
LTGKTKQPKNNKVANPALHPNIFFLGIVSFLTDVSSEMIFTLMPLFLANILGATTVVIGFIEGLADSTASLVRIISGWLTDRVGKRKPFAFAGYALSTIAKPFMYLATTWPMVLAVRFTDRLGKGIRTAPRDALVADSATPENRGQAFGFHRALDTSGAVFGLSIAAIVVFLTQKGALELVHATYRLLVLVGIIPAVIALLFFLFIREAKRQSGTPNSAPRLPQNEQSNRKGAVGKLNKRFCIFLAVIFVFTLGNSSDAFLVLRAQNVGNSVFSILLMMVLFNAVYASVSTPAGILSDRLGRRRLVLLGWLIYGITYLGFATASASWQVWLLFALYGVYYGLAEGVARALVADLVPANQRGTAYGLFHTVVGVTVLPASTIAGWLWHTISPAATFYFGAGLALLAMLGLACLLRE